jgi:phage FluMu gp28-like protein
MSTPKGRNDFWQLYQRGLDPFQTEWACWQMPTSTNPFIPPGEVEAARLDSPEDTFRKEYLAEFLEDSAVFTKVRESATAKEQGYAQDGYPSHPRHSYVVGVDWGKYEDYSVFAVIDTTVRELCHLDRSNHLDYTLQVRRLEDICKRYQVSQVIAEGNAQATTIELLRKANLPVREFTTSNVSKQNIIEGLKLGLEQGRLKILDNSVLLSELQAFEATRLPGGGLRYAAPSGYHDDCVMALALAWDAAKDSNPVRVEKRSR